MNLFGEIFKSIAEMFSEEKTISQIFNQTSKELEINDTKTSLENAIEKNRANLNLNNEDIDIIKSLGKMLGKTDVEGQVSEINLTSSFLETQILKAEEECKKNEKMYKTLGTIVGLAIVIILI